MVAKIEDLKKAVLALKQYAGNTEDHDEAESALSVADTLQEAIGETEDLDDDVLCYLKVEKVPTKEEIVYEKSCSTDCIRYRQGDCPFLYEERANCPRVRQIYEDFFGEDKNVE